jgi:hypothetical protein
MRAGHGGSGSPAGRRTQLAARRRSRLLIAYDALNRVLTSRTDKAGQVIYSADYTYDLVGNRLEIDEVSRRADDGGMATRALRYSCDQRYQLTSESWGGDYTCDLAGNRLTMDHNGEVTTYACNSRNELESWTRTDCHRPGEDGPRRHRRRTDNGQRGSSPRAPRMPGKTDNRMSCGRPWRTWPAWR